MLNTIIEEIIDDDWELDNYSTFSDINVSGGGNLWYGSSEVKEVHTTTSLYLLVTFKKLISLNSN